MVADPQPPGPSAEHQEAKPSVKARGSHQQGDGTERKPPTSEQPTPSDRSAEPYSYASESREERARRETREWLQTIFSAAVAAATIATVIAMGVQYGSMERALEATKEGIRESRRTAEAIERPWVLYDPTPTNNPVTADVEVSWITQQSFGVFIKNFGKGPAYEISAKIWAGPNYVVRRYDLPALRYRNPLSLWPDGFIPVSLRELAPLDALPATGWSRAKPPYSYPLASESYVAANDVLPPGEAARVQYIWKAVGIPEPSIDIVARAIVAVRYRDQFGYPHSTVFCVVGRVGNERDAVHPCAHTNYAD